MRQHIELSPSRYLALTLIAAHGMAMAVSLLLLPLWAGMAAALLLLVSLRQCLLCHVWLSLPHSCAGLVLEEEGAVFIRRDGAHLPCRILPGSLVSPWLTVLNAQPQNARGVLSIVILPDSLDAESFRQLRVRLRWGNYSSQTDN